MRSIPFYIGRFARNTPVWEPYETMKVLKKILKDLNGASSGGPRGPKEGQRGLNEALGRPIRPYGGPRGPRGGSRGPQGPWVFRGPLDLRRLFRLQGPQKQKLLF